MFDSNFLKLSCSSGISKPSATPWSQYAPHFP
jgi:hypothetical protein